MQTTVGAAERMRHKVIGRKRVEGKVVDIVEDTDTLFVLNASNLSAAVKRRWSNLTKPLDTTEYHSFDIGDAILFDSIKGLLKKEGIDYSPMDDIPEEMMIRIDDSRGINFVYKLFDRVEYAKGIKEKMHDQTYDNYEKRLGQYLSYFASKK